MRNQSRKNLDRLAVIDLIRAGATQDRIVEVLGTTKVKVRRALADLQDIYTDQRQRLSGEVSRQKRPAVRVVIRKAIRSVDAMLAAIAAIQPSQSTPTISPRRTAA